MKRALPDSVLRFTAAVTAFAFISLQLFAPVARAENDPIPAWLMEDQGGWLSAGQAQKMQRADQELLAFLSSLQNSQDRMVTSSESGVEALYAGQELIAARDSGNNLLWTPTLNDQGEVENGTLLLADGTLQTLRDGQVVRQVDPFGTEVLFDENGRASSETAADGTRSDYSYNPTTRTTHLPTGALIQTYDAQDRLENVTHPDGRAFTYTEGRITSATTSTGTLYTYSHTTDAAGTLTAVLNTEISGPQEITLPDGTRLIYEEGWLRQSVSASGITSEYSYTFHSDGSLTDITVTATDGSAKHYSADGSFHALIESDGTRWDFFNGWITQKTAPDGSITHFSQTTTAFGRQIVQESSGATSRFSFDEAGGLYAAGTDQYLSTPLFTTPLATFNAGTLSNAGIIATDGVFLYVKPFDNSNKTFTKVGTGFGGTVAGQTYGTLAGNAANTLSATFYSDGFLYQPDPTNAFRVEQIDPASGEKTFAAVPDGFLRLNTAKAEKGDVLITSDGRYIYNLSYHQTRNSTTLNGWTIRVFDPKAGWALVTEFTSDTTSFKANGLMSDGVFLYALEWDDSTAAQVATIRISDGAVVQTGTFAQKTTKAVNGQYDWVNQQFWLGAKSGGKVYAYDDPNDLALSSWSGRPGLSSPASEPDVDISQLPQSSVTIPEAPADFIRIILYNPDGSVKETRQADGTITRFQNGLPSETILPDGTITTLSATQQNGLTSLTVSRQGTVRTYSADGALSNLSLSDGSQLQLNGETLQQIGLSNGATVTDGIYDGQNQLVSGTVRLPDGRTIRYAAGQPAEAALADGSIITYTDGQPIGMTMPDGTNYVITRNGSGETISWTASLRESEATEAISQESLTELIYSSDWILQAAVRADGARLNYTAGRLSTLTQPDGTVISYAYDSADRITSTVAVSPDSSEPPVRSEYAYDKIRAVYKGDQLLYEYSYEFEADGSEITVLREIPTGLIKRYRDSLLLSQTDPDGAVTSYEYTLNPAGYEDPFLTATEMTRLLADGTATVHYGRSVAGEWTVAGMTLADGTYLPYEQLNPEDPLDGYGSLESWSNGPVHAPDGWKWAADIGASFSQETNPENVHSGSSSVKLITPSGGGEAMLYRDIAPMYSEELADYEGKTVTFGAWVKTNDSGVALVLILDDVTGITRSQSHPGDGQWHFLTVSRTVPGGIAKLPVFLSAGGSGKIAYFDDAVFVIGPAILAQDFSALLEEAALPSDPAVLRRMAEDGVLRFTESDSVGAGTAEAQSPVLVKSTVSYQSKPRDTFTYRYGAGLTHITDQTGVTRTYDQTQNLVSIEEPDGTRYDVAYAHDLSSQQVEQLQAGRRHTLIYTGLNGQEQAIELPDPDLAPFQEQTGEEILIHHLSRRRLPDGTELSYQFGQLDKILLPDGRVLTHFTVDRNGIPLRATLTLPDGTVKTLQNGALIEVTRPEDGVKLRYRDNQLAEIHVPVDILNDVTVSSVGLDAAGRIESGEVLLPSGDRLMLTGGRFSGARLADGTEIRSVTVIEDAVTGATLNVQGSNATLHNSRDVGVVLPSGQEYRYRYAVDSAGNPTQALETMTFRDDFEDGNSLGWTVQAGSGWSVTGGDLRAVDTEYGFVLATTGLNWADYSVTTRFDYESFSGPAKEVALLLRWQGPSSYYMARILDRSFQGRGWVLELAGPLTGERVIAGLGAFDPAGTHTLRVDVRGSTFDFYLDGQHLGSTSDSQASRGTVGFGANHATVRFHDLEVTFPGEDLRDPATRDVDHKLRDLREAVAQASDPLARIGAVPAGFDPAVIDPVDVRILEESGDPDVQTAVSAVVQAASDPNLAVISEVDSKERPLAVTKINGSTTAFNEFGNPLAEYDRDGRRQITYSYDSQGRLAKTTLEADRADLSEQMAVLAREITRRKAEASRDLAEQAGVIDQEMEIQMQVAREQLANQKNSLQGQMHSLESTGVSGKAAKAQKGAALNLIRAGIQELEEAQEELERQYVDALSSLRSEIAEANRQMEEQTASAFSELELQKEAFLKGILRQEILPIVGEAYRLTIGRDPNSESEIRALVDEVYARFGGDPSASIDRDELEDRIRNLPDYQERVDQVTAIKQQVSAWLQDVIASDAAAKQSRFLELGLSPDETVPLTQADADRILSWLNSGSLHFGHSAFLALKEFLAAQGIEASAIELAVQAIQIDILAGVINPKTTGDLQLSLFALQRVTGLHGGSATPVRVSFDDLRTILAAGPAVAHVNGNHYFLLQSIAADGTVTYREPNQGPTGETLTMSQAEFQLVWKGILLSPRAPPHAHQILTTQEAQKITGSLWPLIAFILFVISTGLQFVQNETVQLIGRIIGYIAIAISVFNLAFHLVKAGILEGIKTAFSGFGKGLMSGVQTLGQSVWRGVTGIAKTLFTPSKLVTAFKAATPAAGEAAKTTLTQLISTTVFSTGVNIGVSKGFEALGFDSSIASLAGAFASGGITGGFNHSTTQSFSLGGAVSGAVTSTAIAGTQIGLVKAGLDPALANIAGIGVGTITNSLTLNGLDGLGHTLSTQLLPTLTGELAFYGITKLGESIGLDPRISQLAGIPVRNSVKAYLTGNPGQQIAASIGSGLAGGITSVGLEFAFEELNLNPLVGSIAAAGISGSIEGMLEGKNPLLGAAEAYTTSATGILSLGGYGTTPGERALYLSKVNDLSNIIQEQGIANALESYATGIFHRQTIENIWKAGGIYDLLANNAEIVTNDEGITVKRLYLNKTNKAESEYIDISLGDDQLVGYKEVHQDQIIITDCVYEVGPDGRVIAKDERKRVYFDDGRKEVYVVKDHHLMSIEKIDPTGKTILWVQPAEGKQGIEINPNDTIKSGRLFNFEEGWIMEIKNNEIVKSILLQSSALTKSLVDDFKDHSTDLAYFSDSRLVVTIENGNVRVETVPNPDTLALLEGSRPKISLISANGINNPQPEGFAPEYEAVYRRMLSLSGTAEDAIYLLPLYEEGDIVNDTAAWIFDALGNEDFDLTQEVIAKYDTNISLLSDNKKHESKTAILYSGSLNPFMSALDLRHDFKVETIISLGGPSLEGTLFQGKSSNPNLKKIYNIYGSNDIVPLAALNKSFLDIEVLNIKILGATHFDYFYKPSSGIINDKSSKFVELLSDAVIRKDASALNNLLAIDAVKYDEKTGTYIVDFTNSTFTGHTS